MKITKLELKNFKRFDDLTIDLTSLVEPAKLVLLIGANGSGKSSVFDAFEYLNTLSKLDGLGPDYLYYRKIIDFDVDIKATVAFKDQSDTKVLRGPGGRDKIERKMFYGRSSLRQVPKLTRTNLGAQTSVSFEEDNDQPRAFIDRDNRFDNDIEKITYSILTDVFKGNISTNQIIESYINPINKSFNNVFGINTNTSIKLISIKPPLEGNTAEILFEKGNSTIPYNLLSSGEKEIFNILLNLLTRKEYFQDTIYFLDEIDLHLNTQLQKNLLKEVTENWIPENCQLWTASHSLGFIEYANEAEHATIIDFDNLNFDVPQVITPSPKKNFDVFEIAVSKEFLSKVFEGKRIIFCENTDETCYNNLELKNTVFIPVKDKKEVFFNAKSSSNCNGLIDRDYLTDEERNDICKNFENLFILEYYSIENYLYHPNNLKEYYKNKGNNSFDIGIYERSITEEKSFNRDRILLGVSMARKSYPFFQKEYKPQITKRDDLLISQILDSEDFETFYKIFPAKDYGKQIQERQNLNKNDLAETSWFKTQIAAILTK